jgi:hypothetical protein
MHSFDEAIPEFLRESGTPKGEPPEKRGPESDQLPGKIEIGHRDNRSIPQDVSRRQDDVANRKKPVSLSDLDLLLPQLQLRAYRPRIAWQQEAPSNKQLEYLHGIGISSEGFTNRGLTSKVLDFFRGRRERGLASLRQLIALIGAEVAGAEHVSFEDAKRILSERYGRGGGVR